MAECNSYNIGSGPGNNCEALYQLCLEYGGECVDGDAGGQICCAYDQGCSNYRKCLEELRRLVDECNVLGAFCDCPYHNP